MSDDPNWQKQVVAVTGTIGSGKSTVIEMLRNLGAFTISADELAREVTAPDSSGLEAIRRVFGEQVIKDGQTLDRAALGKIVFSSPEQRKRLEAITHPRIRELAAKRFTEALQEHRYPLYVYEIPLLFESGLDRAGFKKIVVVSVEDEIAIDRVASARNCSKDEVRQRLAQQLPREYKAARADYLVDNSGSRDDLQREVVKLFATLTA